MFSDLAKLMSNAEVCFWAQSTSSCCSGNGTQLHPCESISTVNKRENKVRAILVLHKLNPRSHARQCAAAKENKTKPTLNLEN